MLYLKHKSKLKVFTNQAWLKSSRSNFKENIHFKKTIVSHDQTSLNNSLVREGNKGKGFTSLDIIHSVEDCNPWWGGGNAHRRSAHMPFSPFSKFKAIVRWTYRSRTYHPEKFLFHILTIEDFTEGGAITKQFTGKRQNNLAFSHHI